MRHPDQIEVQNVNHPGRISIVDARMYVAIKAAFLAILPTGTPGLTVAQIHELTKPRVPRDANASWWVKTVQLDLEAKGIIARERCSPIRLYRIPAN
ncbi:MAG TPA: hypothetical protein VNV25_12475 [Gemmatimonadaceae bacterium]|jgi:hypothetical protein|nr:hypothetical protein [Gemmatimonadaceae bacterium]